MRKIGSCFFCLPRLPAPKFASLLPDRNHPPHVSLYIGWVRFLLIFLPLSAKAWARTYASSIKSMAAEYYVMGIQGEDNWIAWDGEVWITTRYKKDNWTQMTLMLWAELMFSSKTSPPAKPPWPYHMRRHQELKVRRAAYECHNYMDPSADISESSNWQIDIEDVDGRRACETIEMRTSVDRVLIEELALATVYCKTAIIEKLWIAI